jgi:subtilisin-like proprotein convertase family protein
MSESSISVEFFQNSSSLDLPLEMVLVKRDASGNEQWIRGFTDSAGYLQFHTINNVDRFFFTLTGFISIAKKELSTPNGVSTETFLQQIQSRFEAINNSKIYSSFNDNSNSGISGVIDATYKSFGSSIPNILPPGTSSEQLIGFRNPESISYFNQTHAGFYVGYHPTAVPGKNHLYVVYRDGFGGVEFYRGGPPNETTSPDLNGNLLVESGVSLGDSIDSYKIGETPLSRHETYIPLFPGTNIEQVKQDLKDFGQSINNKYEYNIFHDDPNTRFVGGQNSNTLVRVYRDVVFKKYSNSNLIPDGINPDDDVPGFNSVNSKLYSETVGKFWGEQIGQQLGTNLSSQMLNVNVNPSGGSSDHSNNDTSNSWQNNIAISGGNWNVAFQNLNNNGASSVTPSSIVSDNHSPGRNTLVNPFSTQIIIEGQGVNINGIDQAASLIYNPALGYELIGGLVEQVQGRIVAVIYGDQQHGGIIARNVDPLVLDLDGDGVESLDFRKKLIFFDIDNDQNLEQTGWISGDDGFVVLDKNGDGIINDVSEMFSEYFVPGVHNGFEALATKDSNNDGVFNAQDTAFNQVRIWKDSNLNGQTDPGELYDLSTLGISSISLKAAQTNGQLLSGNEVLASGTYTTADGQIRTALALNFLTNPNGHQWVADGTGTRIISEVGITSYVANDPNGEIVDIASKAINSAYGGSGNDRLIGDEQDNWLGGNPGSDTLIGGGGNDFLMIDSEDRQANIDGGDGFDIVQVVGNEGVYFNLFQAHVETALGGRGSDVLIGGGNISFFIAAGAGNDVIIGGIGNDALSGEDGDDFIHGLKGNDLIRGHRGEDLLIGGEGDDVIDGGLDNDVLQGNEGNDILIGGKGDDYLDGGIGTNIAEFTGNFDQYILARNTDGTITATDKVAERDGTDTLKNIQAANFANIKEIKFDLPNPLPVKDIIPVSGNGTYIISTAALVANDVDYQNNSLSIRQVLGAQGGTVKISGSNIIFTPTAGYKGVMSFRYKLKDSQGNFGANVKVIGTNRNAEMEGVVYLQKPEYPTDPLLYDQWYISQANILPVWTDYTGKGVNVGIFELGVFDYNHPDLKANVNPNFLNSPNLPTETSTHATLVSGVLAGSRNGIGGVGVAYDAKISGYGLSVEDLNNLKLYPNFDIVNNSWSPSPRFVDNFLTNLPLANAFQSAVVDGRNGLGTVIVFAAGNEREKGGNANDTNVINNRFSIAVGAINAQEDLGALIVGQKPFSNPGSSILVSAPGSNVKSTSRLLENNNGSTFGSDYETAQGTSFAVPLVSGVVALMLEANPNLGYRDVQEILAYSARTITDAKTDWKYNTAKNWNGRGLHTSHDYGFGNVDALAAVRLAETWTDLNNSFNEKSISVTSSQTNLAIPDLGTLSNSVNVTNNIQVEHAEAILDLDHANLGDLIIKLVSPTGTKSILMNRLGKVPGSGVTDKGQGATQVKFSFSTTHDWGEIGQGKWTLKITDRKGKDVGKLKSWQLNLYGKQISTNNTYIYTNEFAKLARGGRATLTDTTGIDAINAAAITSNSKVNLTPGAVSTLAGKFLTINANTVIENAFTGDGNDILTGNNGDNLLYGGRGNDNINGGAGKDIIIGAQGNDTLTGGTNTDKFVIYQDSNSSDVVTDFTLEEQIQLVGFSQIKSFSDLTFTQTGANTIINLGNGQTLILNNINFNKLSEGNFITNTNYGDSGNDILRGNARNDVIYLQGDKDNIYGGIGSDRFVVVPNSKSYDWSLGANGLVANNVIWDFTPSDINEKIDFSAINNVTSLQDLRLQNMTINGNQFTWVYFTGNTPNKPNQYVVLRGVNKSDLTANNFIFHQNVAPVAVADTVVTDEDKMITISSASLLANDQDADDHILKLTEVNNGVNGVVTLDINGNVVFNPTPNFYGNASFNYTISDGHNGTATQKVTVQVKPINDAPNNLTLSNTNIAENQPIGKVIGNFTSTDPDANNTFTYSLVSGIGATDNALFYISNNQLKTNKSFDFETKNSYIIQVRTTDQGRLSFEKQFTIGITDIDNIITGNANNENFTTTTEKDIIDSQGGNDTITSVFNNLQQNDIINGGTGFDTLNITGGTATNSISIDLNDTTNQVNISGTTITNFEQFNLSNFAGQSNFLGNSANNIFNGGNGNDIINGGDGDDTLIGGKSQDILTGSLGIDRFDYRNLTDSLLSGFDVITDFNAMTGNDLFRVSTARAGFVKVGAVNTLNAAGIGAKLTATAFKSNFAAQFSLGQRTFVAINDATAGFNAATDAIIEVTGLTGTLNVNNFVIS